MVATDSEDIDVIVKDGPLSRSGWGYDCAEKGFAQRLDGCGKKNKQEADSIKDAAAMLPPNGTRVESERRDLKTTLYQ